MAPRVVAWIGQSATDAAEDATINRYRAARRRELAVRPMRGLLLGMAISAGLWSLLVIAVVGGIELGRRLS